MKNYIVILAVVLLIGSCAKPEELILEGEPNTEKNFFVIDQSRTFRYESQNGEDDQFFAIDVYEDYSNFVEIGDVGLSKSYIYGDLGGSYNAYSEDVYVKKNKETIIFKIAEKHNQVYSNYSSNYDYDIAVSDYQLHLLKPNLELNQKWTTSESVTLSYEGRYSSYPTKNDETSTSKFNYEVIEFKKSKEINDTYYSNIITIRVVYNIGSASNLTRTYTFADQIGLVAYSIGNKFFLLD